MKTAIYIREGRQQIVLSPENEWERNICKDINSKKIVETYFGQFTDVQGGWTMYSNEDYRGKEQNSLMIVLDNPDKKTTT